jgi:hypothetical protein
MKGEGTRRTQLLDDFRHRRRYLELKEEAEDKKDGNDSLSIKHKEEIHISHKSMDLLISRTTQLLDDLSNRRTYLELKEEAKDLNIKK